MTSQILFSFSWVLQHRTNSYQLDFISIDLVCFLAIDGFRGSPDKFHPEARFERLEYRVRLINPARKSPS